ncbi:uncharacterized protein RCC_11506 [Ramularia collo-cygni]|uniref:Uncharacterized protein n=1 Tax=Ramularia collo-cygni TaxID=112498 RepID=A0A2D3VJS5_9PEZI|nr:uncharacterized protein RCC_11506 [Ramularia collo-cygni]CZT25837.1 uncharacterized protein RCC_11506 [Ramularia collo-cygni]
MALTTLQRAVRALRCRDLAMPPYKSTLSQRKRAEFWSAAINSVVLPKLRAKGWICDEDDKTLANQITAMICEGAGGCHLQYKICEVVPPAARTDIDVDVFAMSVMQEVRAIKAETGAGDPLPYIPMVKYKSKELPALRLHLVGRGQVGKNYTTRTLREAALARARPKMLAKGLYNDNTATGSVQHLPRFIVRFALRQPHQQSLECDREPDNAASHLDFNPAQNPDPQGTCHLGRLPAELRNLIYHYAFSHHTNSSGEVSLLTEPPPAPALSRTCKQIRLETTSMYAEKLQQFWRSSNFFIDAAIFPTGWHLRHQLLRCINQHWKGINNLRLKLVGKNGAYNVIWKKDTDSWLAKREGGPDAAANGIGGFAYGAVDLSSGEDVVICRVPRRERPRRDDLFGVDRLYREYFLTFGAHVTKDALKEHQEGLADGTRGRAPLEDQIYAVLGVLNIWT